MEFQKKMNKEFLPVCYDTKVLCLNTGNRNGKSDLQSVYKKCTDDKKFNNNICIEPDLRYSSPEFSLYFKNGGQGHDAGFDAFMTGLVFVSLSKFYEIGLIINRSNPNPEQDQHLNKRQRKALEKGIQPEKDTRKIKHFSAVQNKQIYYPDILHMRNLIMMNIEVPCYWHMNPNSDLTEPELEHIEKMNRQVLYFKLEKIKNN